MRYTTDEMRYYAGPLDDIDRDIGGFNLALTEAADEIDRLRSALRVFGKTSMSEIRPTRNEHHVGWQDVDGQYGVKRSDISEAMAVARSIQ